MFLRHVTGFQSFSRKYGRISNGTLERSLLGTNPRTRGRPYKNGLQVILTLDPKKFAEKKQKRLHLGNLQSFGPHVSLLNHSSLVKVPRLDYEPSGKRDKRILTPYPPDTKAFLYYSLSPGKPRIAGELRLRVASSDDYVSFESGSDLLRKNGHAWTRPLYSLPKYYFPLYEKLREEKFVSDDLHRVLSTLLLTNRNPRYRSSHLFYTLNDPFIVDFSSPGLLFFVITEKGVQKLPFMKIFSDGREMCNGRPYTGSALARFERSTLQEHNGSRSVVLRFLKIITPVKCVIPLYDGYICCPKEGELHRRSYPKSDESVWSVNIDKSKGAIIRGLQLLWDT